MNRRDLDRRIDAFFSETMDRADVHLLAYVDRLYSSYCDAEKAFQRQLFTYVAAWILYYAISAGIVSGGEISSFKLKDISYALLLAPAIFGFLAYALAASAFWTIVQNTALNKIYKHTLPKAHENDLDLLIGAPTLFRAERHRRKGEHKALVVFTSQIVIAVLLCVITVGTLAAVAHAGYILWHVETLPRMLKILSIALGSLLWLRGMLLVYRTGEY